MERRPPVGPATPSLHAGFPTYRYRRHLPNLFLAALVILLALLLMRYPDTGVEAAKEGLRIFLEIVFPSLLPFFILSEFFLALGVVHFLGVLLEPLMRPLFNVPGVGAFALSMGLAAGYPMDAVITARFRQQGMCSREEGERLLAFTNTADPLFILGAVAVGMFGRADLGVLLAIAHYLSAFSVGFIFRFYGREKGRPQRGARLPARVQRAGESSRHSVVGWLRRAVRAMQQARRDDGRTLGALLNDSVQESVSTLWRIGGFIMFFAVLSALLLRSGLLSRIAWPVAMILRLVGIDPQLAPPTLAGVLELDIGTAQAAATQSTLTDRLIVASAIIAWSGLSVHGQVASIIHATDLRMGPYVVARLLHALLAAIYTSIACLFFPQAVATFSQIGLVPQLSLTQSLLASLASWRQWPALLFATPHLAFAALTLLAMAGWRRRSQPPSPVRPRRQSAARSAASPSRDRTAPSRSSALTP
ncbi:MAG: sporulation integral membrane protein YlbJ [Limnochordales bacterium]|nr:sporulation integral membrane protein YlbJ [Limnochordales bacterium]